MKSAGSCVINKHFPLLNSVEAGNTVLIHITAASTMLLLHSLVFAMIITGMVNRLPFMKSPYPKITTITWPFAGSLTLILPHRQSPGKTQPVLFTHVLQTKNLIRGFFKVARPKTIVPMLKNWHILSLLGLFISFNTSLHLLLSCTIFASGDWKSACFRIIAQLLHRGTMLKTSVHSGPVLHRIHSPYSVNEPAQQYWEDALQNHSAKQHPALADVTACHS